MPYRVPSHTPARLPAPGRHREYDRAGRDPESKRFYDSGRWRKARLSKLRTDPLCERCRSRGLLVPAAHVHHRIELRDAPELALDESNLESLCHPCHSRHHAAPHPDH